MSAVAALEELNYDRVEGIFLREMPEGRTKAQLAAYLRALPEEVKAGIDEVCICSNAPIN